MIVFVNNNKYNLYKLYLVFNHEYDNKMYCLLLILVVF